MISTAHMECLKKRKQRTG